MRLSRSHNWVSTHRCIHTWIFWLLFLAASEELKFPCTKTPLHTESLEKLSFPGPEVTEDDKMDMLLCTGLFPKDKTSSASGKQFCAPHKTKKYRLIGTLQVWIAEHQANFQPQLISRMHESSCTPQNINSMRMKEGRRDKCANNEFTQKRGYRMTDRNWYLITLPVGKTWPFLIAAPQSFSTTASPLSSRLLNLYYTGVRKHEPVFSTPQPDDLFISAKRRKRSCAQEPVPLCAALDLLDTKGSRRVA